MEDSTRPGDSRNTVSLVAVDVNTGKLKWAYQQVPHDRWGYDVASPPVLIDFKKDGKTMEDKNAVEKSEEKNANDKTPAVKKNIKKTIGEVEAGS